MNESRISVRYSRALFLSALEKNNLDRINSDMNLVKEVCNVSEVKELLSNPVIVASKKTEILHDLLEKNLEELTMSLIDLVVKNGREKYLPAIARVFMHEVKKHKGITEMVLTTAMNVSPAIKKQISEKIEKLLNTRIELKENVDESIIGGFVLKVEDNYIDASVKNKLNKIKKELSSGSTESLF